jgi:hypothetical protein
MFWQCYRFELIKDGFLNFFFFYYKIFIFYNLEEKLNLHQEGNALQGTPQGTFSELAPLTPFPQASECSPWGGGLSLAVEGVGGANSDCFDIKVN